MSHPVPPPAEMPGRFAALATALADRYRVERELGAGGMATVYLAHDLKHDRPVAIKVLEHRAAAGAEDDRFQREIRTAARLSHPHILSMHDSGELEGMRYYVMPFVPGESLRDRLAREGPLPVADAVQIAGEVADALDYAHRAGIVHRDIKPENILLQEGHAVVMDFGIARVGDGNDHTNLTATGMIIGTPAYLSPEQATGEELDGRSDLYSLGCVLYECLAGAPPFSGTAVAVIAQRVLQPAPSVRERRADVSDALGLVVQRALATDRQARFPTGQALAAALREPAPGRGAARRHAILVLPFANLSPDPENEFFSDGLTEEIITDLSRVKALSVISRTSAMQFKGTSKDVRTIGRELGVGYVLTGSVRKAGQSLRIAAQLIDASNDAQLWGDKYGGTVDEVFDVQERVSRSIVAALEVELTPAEDVRLSDRPIRDPRAFEAYLKAKDELRRWGTSTSRADLLIQQAVELEGNSPALRALKAFMLYAQVRAGVATTPDPLGTIETEAQQLIALAPEAAYGHALRGYVAYERGDHRTAVRHLTRALELDPNDSDVRFCLGIAYQAAGQIQDSRRVAEEFVMADPLAPFAWVLVSVSEWFLGNPLGRADALERALAMDPQNPIMHWGVGYSAALGGQPERAVEHAEWMRMHAPGMSYTVQLSALVDAEHGRQEAALAALRALDITPLDAHQIFHMSESFGMAGDTARALELLERAVVGGFYPDRFITEYCRFLAPLRDLPEFGRIAELAERRVREFSA